MRACFDNYSYLQYTATPQGPILISRLDELSPDFIDVLEPGDNYVGCKELFTSESPHIKIIPKVDIDCADRRLITKSSPKSLRKAIVEFLIGATSGFMSEKEVRDEDPEYDWKPRSMMIHSDRFKVSHKRFVKWTKSIQESIVDRLKSGEGTKPYREIKEEFQEAYANIKKTANNIQPFDEIFENLTQVTGRTRIEVLNSDGNQDVYGQTSWDADNINWKKSYSWIVIGGDLLNRGTTIEGLTVTYMPRSPGGGNADTIQQRARFAGYKKNYIGFIRIYVVEDIKKMYQKYVTHEEHLREALRAHKESGKSMKKFRREMILDRSMRPTRPSIISDTLKRFKQNEWFLPKCPHESRYIITENRKAIKGFINKYESKFLPGTLVNREEQFKKKTSGRLLSLQISLTKVRIGKP